MVPFNLAMYLAQSAAGVGVLGSIVGGSAAAAKNIKDHRKGNVSTNEALYDTGKEGMGAGVATAISALSVGVVGGGLAVSLGTAFVAAVGAKFVWDRAVERVESLSPKEPANDSFVKNISTKN